MLQSQKIGQRGFTLTESMIALALISIITLGVMHFVSNASDDQMFIEVKSTQMNIKQQLMRSMGNMNTLQRSINRPGAGNKELQRCMDSGAGALPGDCTAIGEANKRYFDLYAADGKIIAGTDSTPVNYDKRGKICVPDGGRTCPFSTAKAYFYGTCNPVNGAAVSACPQVSNLVVKFEITQSKPDYLGRPMKDLEFKIMHRVQKEALTRGAECPSGAEVKGMANGLPVCQCRAGYQQSGTLADGSPVCTPLGTLTCKDGELLRGRKANGSPICLKATISCSTINFADTSATCPAGGWLENIDLGVCRPKPAGKKASSKEIYCDRNRGRCCKYVY